MLTSGILLYKVFYKRGVVMFSVVSLTMGNTTGLFGKSSVNSVAKWDGLVFGDYRLFLAQVLSIVITIAVAIVGTLICIGIVRIFTPLRVDPKEELVGLDATQHGENAYPSFNGFD